MSLEAGEDGRDGRDGRDWEVVLPEIGDTDVVEGARDVGEDSELEVLDFGGPEGLGGEERGSRL